MIMIKNAAQIEKMRAAGALLARIRDQIKEAVKPGMTTLQLDEMAETLIREAGATPSFKGYHGFPSTLCTSVDSMVVHGFPDKKPLEEGQLLSIDTGLVLDGWQADSAVSVLVGGKGTEEAEKLLRVTEECFWHGLKAAREGNRVGDIGYAVQKHAEENGFGVIRVLCGHGIGRNLHEEPDVPNFGEKGRGPRLKRGMTICIEPMISAGHYAVHTKPDGWGVVTDDGSICSHYEHTICITADAPEILTLGGKECK